MLSSKNKVLHIFDKIGCIISPDHIESCHCINKKSDTVIVKLSLSLAGQNGSAAEIENGRI